MKKKFTLIALAFLSVIAFAYQARRIAGEPTTIYSWESPDGTVVQTGGTVAYTNGEGDRLNYAQTFKNGDEVIATYYTMCLNGKKANINDATASTNAGHMLITLNEELQEGDEIAITAFLNKTSSAKSSAYVVFEKGDAIDSGDFSDESNIGLDKTLTPTTKTITVAAGNAGSKTIKLTRGTAGTNLFITKLTITRAASSEPEPTTTDEEVTVDFTDNGYDNAEDITSVTENGVTVAFDKGTNTNAPKWYNTGSAIRLYGSNTMTVSAEKKIKKIVITFGSSDGSNPITTEVGTYADGVWEGESNSVTFTIGGTSGNRRITKLTVTLAESSSPEPTELEVPGTVIWSSDEAVDVDWNSGKSITIPAESFASVNVGDRLNIGILGAPEDANPNNWSYQIAVQDGSYWKNLEGGQTLQQAGDYVHSFIVTGDMLKYMKAHGMIINGFKFQLKKVAAETAYTGTDESIWIGEQTLSGWNSFSVISTHFWNANDFAGVKAGQIIRVTADCPEGGNMTFQYDSGEGWKNYISDANSSPVKTATGYEFTITDEMVDNLNNKGLILCGNGGIKVTQVELLDAPVEPEVVDITVEPTSGDIAEAVAAEAKKVTDAGNVVGNITINLTSGASYTISNSITASKNVTINGNSATIDASALTTPFILMSETPAVDPVMSTDETPQVVSYPIDGITIKDVTITGLPYQLIYANKVRYLMAKVLVENSVIGVNGTAKKTIFDFNGGGNASEIIVNNSTLWANPSNAQNGGLFSSQSGQGSIQDLKSEKQLFAITNSTIYNIANGKTTNSQRRNNTAGMEFQVENSVIVNSGKSGQFIVGLNGGSANSAQTYTISNNLLNFADADVSAAEEAKVKEKIADAALNSIEGVVTFTDAANGDFSGTVLLAPSATAPSALGDPRWSLTYGNALAINITESEGGTVTASPSYAAEGATVTLTATPASGYELASITVKDGAEADVTVNDDNTFTMPATAVTVTATFTKLPVDVNITVESGNDIAVAVETAADGAPIKSITVTLAENGEYTISKSLTSQGNVIINGNGSTVDASGLTGAFINYASVNGEKAKKGDGTDSNYTIVEDVTIKDVTITGLPKSLINNSAGNVLFSKVTIENDVIEIVGNNTIFAFGNGFAGDLKISKSTLWSKAGHQGFLFQAQGRPKDVNSDVTTTSWTIDKSTLYQISKGKKANNNNSGIKGQATTILTLTNSILVDFGSNSGNEVNGWLFGQNSTSPVLTYENNTYWSAATNGEAVAGWTDASKTGSDQTETALDCDPEFKDAANGDFTVGESTEQAELETGDPRWLVEYAGGEGDATALLAEIEEAKKLLNYSMSYYDENNTESPETEGKALVDAIRDAEEQAAGGTSQKKIDKTLEALKQAEIDYANAEMEYELDESEDILAGADPEDELAAELQRLYDTQDIVRANYENQPKNIKNYADRLDEAQKAYLRNALNELLPEAQAIADNPEVYKAIEAVKKALEGDSSEDLFDALKDLAAAMETATGISSVEADETDAPVYNMAGQRVSKTVKGIVIKNGKKYISK